MKKIRDESGRRFFGRANALDAAGRSMPTSRPDPGTPGKPDCGSTSALLCVTSFGAWTLLHLPRGRRARLYRQPAIQREPGKICENASAWYGKTRMEKSAKICAEKGNTASLPCGRALIRAL